MVEREVRVEDAVHGVDLVWGTHIPLETPSQVRRTELLKRQEAENGNLTAGVCGPASSALIEGLSLPGIIIVGPSLVLAAVATLNISLAGRTFEIANFTATVNFVDGSSMSILSHA